MIWINFGTRSPGVGRAHAHPLLLGRGNCLLARYDVFAGDKRDEVLEIGDAEWDVLQSGADNPTYQELVDAINSLSDPERIELLALTWLGRGD